VVCTDADGLPENVADGLTGFVVPRRDPDAIAGKLALLAGDHSLRRRMGEEGRKRVITCFELTRQIDSFFAFYVRILADSAKSNRVQTTPEKLGNSAVPKSVRNQEKIMERSLD